jgi:hypothetical protein
MCRDWGPGGHYTGWSDFFYVPSIYADTFADLAATCTKHAVYLEICAPTIAANFPWASVNPDQGEHSLQGWRFGKLTHFHPVKFSNPENIKLLKKFIEVTEERELLGR